MSFFESVRLALARHPVGVHSLNQAATAAELVSAEQRVGIFPSDDYREFLSTWNGGSMFHESITLCPATALVRRSPDRLLIGECSDGLLFLDAQGRQVDAHVGLLSEASLQTRVAALRRANASP